MRPIQERKTLSETCGTIFQSEESTGTNKFWMSSVEGHGRTPGRAISHLFVSQAIFRGLLSRDLKIPLLSRGTSYTRGLISRSIII